MKTDKISILIPAYNSEKTIAEALDSCIMQSYPNLEIIVSDNYSSDNTIKVAERYKIRLSQLPRNIGGIDNMNRLIDLATGDYLVMLCADDYFTDQYVIEEIVRIFKDKPTVGFIGRYYYQFLDGYGKPIRYFKNDNPYRSADQWSGLAFRSKCKPFYLSYNIFVETVDTVKQIIDKGWDYIIIKWNTVAVRTTNGANGSQNPMCYIQSPLKNWVDLIGTEYSITTSFISLVQIKNWGTYKALFREIWYFVKYRPINLLRIDFWFFSLFTLLTPRFILKRMVKLWKRIKSI